MLDSIICELKKGRAVFINNELDNIFLDTISKSFKPNSTTTEYVPWIRFKIHYTLPYHNFNEIKEFQLSLKQAKRFNRHYYGIVVFDMSDYLGHETEEYFEIFIKYLYDYRQNCRYIFITKQASASDAEKMYMAISKYIRCMKINFPDTYNKQHVINVITEKEIEFNTNFSPEAKNILINISMRCNDSFDNLVEDIICCNESSENITSKDIVTYFSEVNCLYKEFYTKEDIVNEKL